MLENFRLVTIQSEWGPIYLHRCARPKSLLSLVAVMPPPRLVVNVGKIVAEEIGDGGDEASKSTVYLHRAIVGTSRPLHDAAVLSKWERIRSVKRDGGMIYEEYLLYLESLWPICRELAVWLLCLIKTRSFRSVGIYCDGGKDRTGVVIAALQRLVGTRLKAIVDEFETSNDNLPGAALQVIRDAPPWCREEVRLLMSVDGRALRSILSSSPSGS